MHQLFLLGCELNAILAALISVLATLISILAALISILLPEITLLLEICLKSITRSKPVLVSLSLKGLVCLVDKRSRMLLYCFFCSKQLLLHEPNCVLNARNCVILIQALVGWLIILFKSWLLRFCIILSHVVHVVIKPGATCIWLSVISLLIAQTWFIIGQYLYSPLNLVLFLGSFKLFNKVLGLSDVSLGLC